MHRHPAGRRDRFGVPDAKESGAAGDDRDAPFEREIRAPARHAISTRRVRAHRLLHGQRDAEHRECPRRASPPALFAPPRSRESARLVHEHLVALITTDRRRSGHRAFHVNRARSRSSDASHARQRRGSCGGAAATQTSVRTRTGHRSTRETASTVSSTSISRSLRCPAGGCHASRRAEQPPREIVVVDLRQHDATAERGARGVRRAVVLVRMPVGEILGDTRTPPDESSRALAPRSSSRSQRTHG